MFVLVCKQWYLICVEVHSDATSNPKMQENFIHYFVRGVMSASCVLESTLDCLMLQDLKVHHNKCT